MPWARGVMDGKSSLNQHCCSLLGVLYCMAGAIRTTRDNSLAAAHAVRTIAMGGPLVALSAKF